MTPAVCQRCGHEASNWCHVPVSSTMAGATYLGNPCSTHQYEVAPKEEGK